jgi:hypothetical protein
MLKFHFVFFELKYVRMGWQVMQNVMSTKEYKERCVRDDLRGIM